MKMDGVILHKKWDVWQQWHHGATFKDGIAVGPLKNIEPVNSPNRYNRKFKLMRKFCKALDESAEVTGNESIAEIGVKFNETQQKFIDLGILLPKTTPYN